MHSYLAIPSVFTKAVEVQNGEGSSCEQQLNNSGFVSVRVEEIRVFQACRDVTPSVAHLHIRASAPSFFASVSVSAVLGHSVALSFAVGLRRSRRVLYPQQF